MNQNTTIETIREAIGKITRSLTHCRDLETSLPLLREARSALCRLANRLEAAPQPPVEQPPVDQSEQKSGVWIDGEWREFKEAHGHRCPWCQAEVQYRTGCVACGSEYKTLCARLAPPPVIEPEPELDEFEKWATEQIGYCGTNPEGGIYQDALNKYRAIKRRKGDK